MGQKKLAVAIIHGVGSQGPGFADTFMAKLIRQFAVQAGLTDGQAAEALALKPVHWAPVLQAREDRLLKQRRGVPRLRWQTPRQWLIDFAGDALAYQPSPTDRTVYDDIHTVFAEALKALTDEAGGEAPLCVIGHSLGSVIASNYFYDLSQHTQQKKAVSGPQRQWVAEQVLQVMSRPAAPSPLELGHTFTSFYTFGCPVAVWSLRYQNFGSPIAVPATQLATHHRALVEKEVGEWLNFFDRDDVIAYPLRPLNCAYQRAVKKDLQVNVGDWRWNWHPGCHVQYWEDDDVVGPIAQSLARIWRALQ